MICHWVWVIVVQYVLFAYCGRFRLLVRRSGTRCLTSSEIRRVVLTVLSSFLRQSCLDFTNVTRALEVFLKCYALYKSTFYLLTYLFTILIDCPFVRTVKGQKYDHRISKLLHGIILLIFKTWTNKQTQTYRVLQKSDNTVLILR